MKYIFLLVLWPCITNAQVVNLKTFSWSNECGQGNPITVVDLNVTPDPIRLPGKADINITIVSTEDIVDAPGTIVDAILQRDIKGRYVDQPCIDSLSVGSCNYDLCLTLNASYPDGCTEQQIDAGIPCHCKDMVAGEYNIVNFEVKFLKQPPAVLVDGDYHYHVTLTSDHQLLCFDVYLSLTVDLHD